MRRFATFLVAVAMMLTAFGTCLAETDLDLTSMSLEELYELRQSIEIEISERKGGDCYPFPNGNYEVGVDIVAGIYEFIGLTHRNTNIDVYESIDAYKADSSQYKMRYTTDDESSTIVTLHDGEFVAIWMNPCLVKIIPEDSKPAWMP